MNANPTFVQYLNREYVGALYNKYNCQTPKD